MTKSDLIKLRVTPEFKARVQREAAYQQLSVSELVERALEDYLAAPAAQAAAPALLESDMRGFVPPIDVFAQGVADGERGIAEFITTNTTEARGTAREALARALEQDDVSGMVAPSTCEHGRPRGVCWECA